MARLAPGAPLSKTVRLTISTAQSMIKPPYKVNPAQLGTLPVFWSQYSRTAARVSHQAGHHGAAVNSATNETKYHGEWGEAKNSAAVPNAIAQFRPERGAGPRRRAPIASPVMTLTAKPR